MALDPSIALGVKPIELQNPLTQYAQMMQIQGAQNQNALNQYQLSAAKRADEVTNVTNELYAKHFDPVSGKLNQNALNADLIARNQAAQIPVMQAKFADTEQKAAMAQKAKIDAAAGEKKFMDDALRDIHRNPSNETIISWQQDAAMSPTLSPQGKAYAEKQAQTLLAMPVAQRKSYLMPAGASASDLITMRGQNMTDARARDRLAAETASGELSPATVDFVAETYRQTGQLPPLGMGKAAVNMRQKILDRAAQLAMGTGDGAKTPAQAATDVKTAKADTAAQAGAVKDFSSGMSARKVTANNTAINHLATMEKLADDLANSDVRVFNAAANTIGKQFGTTAPTNFDAARQLVASEVIKAVVANGGGVTERQEAAEQFARANSPAQLKGVINTYRELLGGQLSSLGQQYETGTGRKDFSKKLSPETAKILEKAAPAGGVDTKNPLLN